MGNAVGSSFLSQPIPITKPPTIFSTGVAVVGTGDACLNELIIRATPRKFNLLLVGQGFFLPRCRGHFGNNLSLEQIIGFPTPKVFVTADSVIKGKPDPEGKRVHSYPNSLICAIEGCRALYMF